MAHYYTYVSKYERTVDLVMRWTCPYCKRRQVSLNSIKLRSQADSGIIARSRRKASNKIAKYSCKLDRAVRKASLSKLKLRAECGNCHRKPIWSRYILFRNFDRISSFWLIIVLAVIICAVIEPDTLTVPIVVFSIACSPYLFKLIWNSFISWETNKMPYDQVPVVGYLDDENETIKSYHFSDNVGVLVDNIQEAERLFRRKQDQTCSRNTDFHVKTNRSYSAEDNGVSPVNTKESNERLFESAQVLLTHTDDTQSLDMGRKQLVFLAEKENYVPAMLTLADIDIDMGNEAEAFELLRRAADLGDSNGQFRFARFLLTASEKYTNLPLAFAYCEKAANQGNPDAWVLMGDFYKSSNPQRAEQYYKRAGKIN